MQKQKYNSLIRGYPLKHKNNTNYKLRKRMVNKMSMVELNKLILEEKLTIQLMDELYKEYGFGFIIRDGKIKGFTR